MDSKRVLIHYLRGTLYHGSGLISKAIEIFCSGLKHSPTHSDSLYMRGVSYESIGQYRKAWDDFNMVVAKKPTHHAFYHVINCDSTE
jgi:lipoprotein NlpI